MKLRKAGWILGGLTLTLLAGTVLALTYTDAAPRQLGPYLERRAEGHAPFMVSGAALAARILTALDRPGLADGLSVAPGLPPLRVGAQAVAPASVAAAAKGSERVVDTAAEAEQYLAQAGAGDVIVFSPGKYRFGGKGSITLSSAPGVTVRAAVPNTVFLEFALVEGFLVNGARWTFENLHIRGVCATHDRCEHAFHVVAGASQFVARNNTISDFNAHFKINGVDGRFPDRGLLEGNTLTNSSVRRTGNPVTPIDLVGASGWMVRANVITDFIKGGGDRISYGGFFKGGGEANRFERNVVVCESTLRGAAGQRVGLSLGGGGTSPDACRDKRCISEQSGGVIAANLIAACSDEGIYLNRASASKILHNTLVDTAGVMLRFPETSADVEGNIVDGKIVARNDAVLRAGDNRDTQLALLYLGRHPQRALFVDADQHDFRWRDEAPASAGARVAPDLCAATRPATPRYGAFEDFKACQAAAAR